MTTIITPAPAYQKPSGKLYLSADQLNLVSGEWTLIELDTISANFTDGIEDTTNHRITPGQAGFYDIKGQAYLSQIIAGKRYQLAILVNGTIYKYYTELPGGLTNYLTLLVAAHFYLAAADYLELVILSIAGVDTVDLLGSEPYTFMSVQRVR